MTRSNKVKPFDNHDYDEEDGGNTPIIETFTLPNMIKVDRVESPVHSTTIQNSHDTTTRASESHDKMDRAARQTTLMRGLSELEGKDFSSQIQWAQRRRRSLAIHAALDTTSGVRHGHPGHHANGLEGKHMLTPGGSRHFLNSSNGGSKLGSKANSRHVLNTASRRGSKIGSKHVLNASIGGSRLILNASNGSNKLALSAGGSVTTSSRNRLATSDSNGCSQSRLATTLGHTDSLKGVGGHSSSVADAFDEASVEVMTCQLDIVLKKRTRKRPTMSHPPTHGPTAWTKGKEPQVDGDQTPLVHLPDFMHKLCREGGDAVYVFEDAKTGLPLYDVVSGEDMSKPMSGHHGTRGDSIHAHDDPHVSRILREGLMEGAPEASPAQKSTGRSWPSKKPSRPVPIDTTSPWELRIYPLGLRIMAAGTVWKQRLASWRAKQRQRRKLSEALASALETEPPEQGGTEEALPSNSLLPNAALSTSQRQRDRKVSIDPGTQDEEVSSMSESESEDSSDRPMDYFPLPYVLATLRQYTNGTTHPIPLLRIQRNSQFSLDYTVTFTGRGPLRHWKGGNNKIHVKSEGMLEPRLHYVYGRRRCRAYSVQALARQTWWRRLRMAEEVVGVDLTDKMEASTLTLANNLASLGEHAPDVGDTTMVHFQPSTGGIGWVPFCRQRDGAGEGGVREWEQVVGRLTFLQEQQVLSSDYAAKQRHAQYREEEEGFVPFTSAVTLLHHLITH